MVCHSRAANWVLGLTEMQMNKVHDYGGVRDEQLRTLEHLGVFRVNWIDHVEEVRRRGRDWLDAGRALAGVCTSAVAAPRSVVPVPVRNALDAVDRKLADLYATVPEPPDLLRPLEDGMRKAPRYTTLLPRRPGEYRAPRRSHGSPCRPRPCAPVPICRPTAPSATCRPAVAIR